PWSCGGTKEVIPRARTARAATSGTIASPSQTECSPADVAIRWTATSTLQSTSPNAVRTTTPNSEPRTPKQEARVTNARRRDGADRHPTRVGETDPDDARTD